MRKKMIEKMIEKRILLYFFMLIPIGFYSCEKYDDPINDNSEELISTLKSTSLNTIYIDPQYTGTKNGTITQPFNAWSDITWIAGNTYLFKRGSTLNTSTVLKARASNIKVGAYGTGNRPIIRSTVGAGGKILDFGALSNVVVSDLEVISANYAQSCFHFINGGRASVINCKIQGSEWGVRNINSKGLFRIINCEIFNIGDDGSYNQTLDSIEVSGTHIYNVNRKWFTNQSETYSGGDALQLNNVKHFNIYNNILDHSGTGNKFCFISENSNSGLISSGVILNNTFKRSDKGNLIYLYHDQHNVLVKGNKFINAGIAIYNHSLNLRVYYNEFTNISNLVFQGLGVSTSDTRIIHNTFYNVNNLISCHNEKLTFQNNIVYNCYGKTFTGGSNLKLNYNCYYLNSNLGTTNTGTNSIKADPLFNNAANLDFKLKSGSPCIDKASNILGTTTDLAGFNVPYNKVHDIGALESGTTNTVTNQLPVVSITSPSNGQNFSSPSSITITANASDSDGTITKVEFYNGSVKIGESTKAPYSYTWTNVPREKCVLTAIATDNLNGKTTSSVKTIYVNSLNTVTVTNVNPAVSITYPSNGQNFSSPVSITITANASDSDGTIAKVEFYNGSVKIGESTKAPYSYTWTNVPREKCVLTAIATDNLNGKTTSGVKTIYVNSLKSSENDDEIDEFTETTKIATTVEIAATSSAGSLNIFPNPNDGRFSINLGNQPKSNQANVTITDLTGKTVYSSGVLRLNDTKEFDFTNFKSGVYILGVTYDNGTRLNKKFIKK